MEEDKLKRAKELKKMNSMRAKKFYYKHRERISQRSKTRVLCKECGVEYTYNGRIQHEKRRWHNYVSNVFKKINEDNNNSGCFINKGVYKFDKKIN